MRNSRKTRELTGRHVFYWTVGFFGGGGVDIEDANAAAATMTTIIKAAIRTRDFFCFIIANTCLSWK